MITLRHTHTHAQMHVSLWALAAALPQPAGRRSQPRALTLLLFSLFGTHRNKRKKNEQPLPRVLHALKQEWGMRLRMLIVQAQYSFWNWK